MRTHPRDRSPKYRTLERKMRDSAYAPLDEIPAWAIERRTYPIFALGLEYEVHLQPRRGHVIVWVVDARTEEVRIQARLDRASLFDPPDTEPLAGSLREERVREVLDVDDGDLEALSDAASDAFDDPFDQTVVESLRPPLVSWLGHRLACVETSADESEDRTMWSVTLAAGGRHNEFESTYPTPEIVSMYAGNFVDDYRRQTRSHLDLNRREGYPLWFDITRQWLTEALVWGYAEDDLRSDDVGDYVVYRSDSGAYHLSGRETWTQPCQHDLPDGTETRYLDLDRLPEPTTLCPHCATRIRELLVDRELRLAN